MKEQLLVFANARLSNPEMKECTLGLVGPPGIGKTMISRLISDALNLPFGQISCGGITEAEILKGYAYTYIGSRPGEIANCLISMKYNNGVIFFDEFEKISKNNEITSMLLHVLDPIQNSFYHDNYIGRDIDINLSGIWFILSMNNLPADGALRDRIFTIQLEGYTEKEKLQIAKRHLIPKILKNLKIPIENIVVPDTVILDLIRRESNNPGVRYLNHNLRDIIYKVHFLQQQSELQLSFSLKNCSTPFILTTEMVDKILPPVEKDISLSMMYL